MTTTHINEVHVEKAHNILNAIPRMSKDIVDDTIYEKVLSFLSSFLDSEAHGVQMYDSWRVLDILTEVSDYQVIFEKAFKKIIFSLMVRYNLDM
jgi:uroporphyrinogen-III decarboxylase